MTVSTNLPLEQIKCDLCESDNYIIIYPACYEKQRYTDIEEKFRSSGDEILIDQVVRCTQCGLTYVNPRLNASLILEGYASGNDTTFVSQAKARERTFERCLNIVERFWKKSDKGKILDVGAAGGSFLYVAKKRGWDVVGCEPNRWLCEWGQKQYGIPIHAGEIQSLNCEDATFDIITLWDVLEHTPSPRKVLEECHRILRPGGLLIVNYPDVGSWISKFMGRKWVFLLSVHLYYFTKTSITNLLKHCGFKIVAFKPHFQTLEVEYIFRRMQAYFPKMGHLGKKLVQKLRLQSVQVPYWIGQTLVIAWKR